MGFENKEQCVQEEKKIANSVFLWDINPNWSGFIRPFVSKNDFTRLKIMDSNIFDKFDKTEMGR